MTLDQYLKSKKCVYCGERLVFDTEIDDFHQFAARGFAAKQQIDDRLSGLMNRKICHHCANEILVKIESMQNRENAGLKTGFRCVRCNKRVDDRSKLNKKYLCNGCAFDVRLAEKADSSNFLEYISRKRETTRELIASVNSSCAAQSLINRQKYNPRTSIWDFTPKQPPPKDKSPRHYSTRTDEEGRTWYVERRGHRGY